ncbi:AurF N-oxygenase family protein [Mycobacterium sp. Aquia_213]|uniref:AurF N-oxygenase family protein n=1 Tax=Mycobacterium sp. Aquia_213 TaxID=2991728 RepID=UPI002270F11A|nr:diiron oxygenase [Mycobacterium sp. Aquia_213]WAC90172.1 diiron oxygenase [Mycobacterium sp. Aquia_213]
MTISATLPEHSDVRDSNAGRYRALLARLSALSVTHHFDAYGDIDWDSAEFKIDRTDPRWELPSDDPLACTEWYQSLPTEQRLGLGLDGAVAMMKTGIEFERILKQGLLEFAGTLPNGAPEFRYAYHEVIEECQHSLMFQEFVNRSGFDAARLPLYARLGARLVIALGKRFPPLFFVFVLGGEEPIDYVQRKVLRCDNDLPPVLERVMRIHVTEEARHLSFARSYLKTRATKLKWYGRLQLGVGAPIILSVMARMMLRPSPQLVAKYSIPKGVLAQAYTNNPTTKADNLAAIRRVRKLCAELGVLGGGYRLLWRLLGLDDPSIDR